SDIDPRLEQVCVKAMQKKKEDRFQSAREMRAALRPMLDARTIGSHPEMSQPQPRLSPMESAATVAFPIGTKEESKPTISAAEMSDEPIDIPRSRVPIPLVAAVMLAIGAVGTIAAISIKKSGEATADTGTASVSASAPASATASVSVFAPASATASASASATATAKPKPTIAPAVTTKASAEPIDPDKASVSIVSINATGLEGS